MTAELPVISVVPEPGAAANPASPSLVPERDPPLPPSSDPPLTLADLRRDIRIGIISSYAANFGNYLGQDFEVDRLEDDLLGVAHHGYSARFACELVLSLSYEKSITMETYLPRLRREFMRRDKDSTVLGNDRYEVSDEEGPKEWEDLSASNKIHVLWRLCEWHLFDSERFRNRIGLNGDDGSWRDEPCATDYAGNAYWYFYDGRLWLQRGGVKKSEPAPLPEPARPVRSGNDRARNSTAKRKASTQASSKPAKKVKAETLPSSRRSSKQATPIPEAPLRRNGRAPPPPRPPIRASRRLGITDEEGWQAVPEELLSSSRSKQPSVDEPSDATPRASRRRTAQTGTVRRKAKPKHLRSTSSSSLSALSSRTSSPGTSAMGGGDEEVDESQDSAEESESEARGSDSEAEDSEAISEPELPGIDVVEPIPPEDPRWVEWEVVCATEDEWQGLAGRLQTSANVREQEMRTLILEEVIPQMRTLAEERAEREREEAEQAAEEAARIAAEIAASEPMQLRKRSSRIATRENELMLQQQLEWEREGTDRILRGGRVTRRTMSVTPVPEDLTRSGRQRRREEEREAQERDEIEQALRDSMVDESRDEGDPTTPEGDSFAPSEMGAEQSDEAYIDGDRGMHLRPRPKKKQVKRVPAKRGKKRRRHDEWDSDANMEEEEEEGAPDEASELDEEPTIAYIPRSKRKPRSSSDADTSLDTSLALPGLPPSTSTAHLVVPDEQFKITLRRSPSLEEFAMPQLNESDTLKTFTEAGGDHQALAFEAAAVPPILQEAKGVSVPSAHLHAEEIQEVLPTSADALMSDGALSSTLAATAVPISAVVTDGERRESAKAAASSHEPADSAVSNISLPTLATNQDAKDPQGRGIDWIASAPNPAASGASAPSASSPTSRSRMPSNLPAAALAQGVGNELKVKVKPSKSVPTESSSNDPRMPAYAAPRTTVPPAGVLRYAGPVQESQSSLDQPLSQFQSLPPLEQDPLLATFSSSSNSRQPYPTGSSYPQHVNHQWLNHSAHSTWSAQPEPNGLPSYEPKPLRGGNFGPAQELGSLPHQHSHFQQTTPMAPQLTGSNSNAQPPTPLDAHPSQLSTHAGAYPAGPLPGMQQIDSRGFIHKSSIVSSSNGETK